MDLSESQLLKLYLDLDRDPVGIRFLFDEQSYDACERKEQKGGIVYCTAVRNAASKKMAVKMNYSHFACQSAAWALGLAKPGNISVSGYRHEQMGLYQDLCTSRNVMKDMVYCSHEIFGVEIAPLESFIHEKPHVLIIVTNPYNAMRIIQGNAYFNGQAKNIKITGNQAICQECTSYPFETMHINISTLCSGTRKVAGWDDSELGIGIPYCLLGKIVEGIEKTINPMETDKNKRRIDTKANEVGKKLDIKYRSNYYIGVYGVTPQNK